MLVAFPGNAFIRPESSTSRVCNCLANYFELPPPLSLLTFAMIYCKAFSSVSWSFFR
jgi:hypothetical protein